MWQHLGRKKQRPILMKDHMAIEFKQSRGLSIAGYYAISYLYWYRSWDWIKMNHILIDIGSLDIAGVKQAIAKGLVFDFNKEPSKLLPEFLIVSSEVDKYYSQRQELMEL